MWKEPGVCFGFWALNDSICSKSTAVPVQRSSVLLLSFPPKTATSSDEKLDGYKGFPCPLYFPTRWWYSFLLFSLFCVMLIHVLKVLKITRGWWLFCFVRHGVGAGCSWPALLCLSWWPPVRKSCDDKALLFFLVTGGLYSLPVQTI